MINEKKPDSISPVGLDGIVMSLFIYNLFYDFDSSLFERVYRFL